MVARPSVAAGPLAARQLVSTTLASITAGMAGTAGVVVGAAGGVVAGAGAADAGAAASVGGAGAGVGVSVGAVGGDRDGAGVGDGRDISATTRGGVGRLMVPTVTLATASTTATRTIPAR